MKPSAASLSQTPFFSDLAPEELDGLKRLTTVLRLPRGAVVFFEGDLPLALYIVKSGQIKVAKASREGREVILGVFTAGASFGDVPVFDGEPYPAMAVTLVDSQIWVIDRRRLEEFLTDHPRIALKIIRILSKRLRQSHNTVMNLALKNVPQRLADMILALAADRGGAQPEIDLNLTRQEMAELIGVSRETLIRQLGLFEKRGLVKLAGKNITMIDAENLRLLAEA
jgi:CRP/FNR family transcriptional regulator, cyclic AMP receptor protein